MNVRIPSSLKWLLEKRARLLDSLIKSDVRLAQCKKMRKLMIESHRRTEKLNLINLNAHKAYSESLKNDLNAIDITLGLHEIPINPDIIQPIRAQKTIRKFPHGTITKLIFVCLRQAKNEPRTSNEIAIFVAQYYSLDISSDDFIQIRDSVRYRLYNLYKTNKLKFMITSKRSERYWQLGEWTALDKIGRPREN